MPATQTQFKEPKSEEVRRLKSVAPVCGSWHISLLLGFLNY